MKHLKTIALAAALMSGTAVNTAAEEFDFQAPSISGKLEALVEAKMSKTIKATYTRPVYIEVVEYSTCANRKAQIVVKEISPHDAEENRS